MIVLIDGDTMVEVRVRTARDLPLYVVYGI